MLFPPIIRDRITLTNQTLQLRFTRLIVVQSVQLFPHYRIPGKLIQPIQQCLKVHSRTTDYHRQRTTQRYFIYRKFSQLQITVHINRNRKVKYVYKMMLYPALFSRIRLRHPNRQTTVELHRIPGDDLSIQTLRQLQTKRTLAPGRRPRNYQKFSCPIHPATLLCPQQALTDRKVYREQLRSRSHNPLY